MDSVVDRAAVVAAYRGHVNVGQAKLAQFLGLPVETSALGAHVVDEAGTRYLDCGGYGVFLLGHRSAPVVEAVHAQLDRQPLSTRLFLNERMAEASRLVAQVAPTGLERVTFTNSGAEATELALKLGRAADRRRVVATHGGFHGKTLGALSATGRDRYRAPFHPLLPEVHHVPFGDSEAMEAMLAEGPPATVILEPVQAEGGVRLPPDGYLAAVHRSCRAHGALLIVDEIQTGLGRLGSWWGVDHDAITPDVLLVGKALGGGVLPAAAVVSSATAYSAFDAEPLLHSSTFAGNPLTASAVCATITTLIEQDVIARVAALAPQVEALVREAVAAAPAGLVADVRCRGLLIGIEFSRPHHSAVFLEEMLDREVIVSHSLNADAVARLTPPVVLDADDLAHLRTALTTSLSSMKP